jgi:hypothetical protein
MIRSIALVSVSMLLVGCDSSDDQGETPQPSNIVKLRSPKFSVPAGAETFSCIAHPISASSDGALD